MPQIVKGGKYVFGWCIVSPEGALKVPEEALVEYGFEPGERLILIPGSRRSGGFGLSCAGLLRNSPIGRGVLERDGSYLFDTPAGKIVISGEKPYCWAELTSGNTISVPISTLNHYGITPGDKLLAVRGSDRAIGFPVRGPIIEEAIRHPEIEVF